MLFQSPSPPPARTTAAFPPARTTAAFPPARTPEPEHVALHSVINDALYPQGLRYDPERDAIVRNGGHSMTLRSHPSSPRIRMCYLRDMLAALREDVTEICFVKKNGTMGRLYGVLTGHATTGNICVNPVPLSGMNHPDRAPYHPDSPFRAWCKNTCASCTAGQPILAQNCLTVWDVQRDAWCSLAVDSILTVNRTLFKL